MSITKQTEAFEALLRTLPEGEWELYDGELREKPPMTAEHASAAFDLGVQLANQLRRDEYRVRVNAGHLQHTTSYFIPDVVVLPAASERAQRRGPDHFEIYDEPVPFVAEAWSHSTGTYDVNRKIPEYQRRGDHEIWRIQPYERSVTIWRRQPDGTYTEQVVTGGKIEIASLPGVVIDLDVLWD